jgi:hypothetical protein
MTRIIDTIVVFLLGAVLFVQYSGAQFSAYSGVPVQGYYQPVKIRGPEGTKIAFSIDEKFVQRESPPDAVGLLVGSDYRLQITNIPFQPGKEVFPTIKIIDRTHPPQGLELEFPIMIDITQEDIELALAGKFVTRVIYLENPQTALPIRSDLSQQITTPVPAGTDPVAIATTLGQPMAIVRIGGRIPNTLGANDPLFFFHSPSWITFDKKPDGHYEMIRYQNSFRPAAPIISGIPGAPLR